MCALMYTGTNIYVEGIQIEQNKTKMFWEIKLTYMLPTEGILLHFVPTKNWRQFFHSYKNSIKYEGQIIYK